GDGAEAGCVRGRGRSRQSVYRHTKREAGKKPSHQVLFQMRLPCPQAGRGEEAHILRRAADAPTTLSTSSRQARTSIASTWWLEPWSWRSWSGGASTHASTMP